jgi:hypothetical protein
MLDVQEEEDALFWLDIKGHDSTSSTETYR